MPTSLPSSSLASPVSTDHAPFSDHPREPFSRAANAASSSSASASASGSASIVSPSAGRDAAEDIEMEPIAGHRRRKSTLLSPINPPPISTAGPGRPRSQSLRNQSQATGLAEEPKIPDDDDAMNSLSPNGRDERDSFSDEDLQDDEETGLTEMDRRRRQKKRRRNTLLDQRIAREKNLSTDEGKVADKSVARSLLTNAILILLWYAFSLSISLYNKWMFDQDNLNFAFPLFTTAMHMLVQFALSALVMYFVPSLRPSAGHNSDQGRSRHESEPSNGTGMTKMFYLTRIGPCGAATGLDIGLGNTSLKMISLTFYTMCKSSSLAFVLLFAFVFRLETPTWRLVTIIAIMTMGVILMVFGEVEFKLGGFILVISAAFFSGLRWGLTQILLLRNPATSNPFSSIFFLTPVMFVTLFLLAIPVEGLGPLFEALGKLSSEWGAVLTPLFLMFPGCIAFCMTASEFALLQRTSVVTLSIAGIFKEVVTISAASLVFKDKLTTVNFVGLLTTMAAIGAYNYIKITKMRQEMQTEAHGNPVNRSESTSPSNNTENEDGGPGEESTGLLYQSPEVGETIFSADGDAQLSPHPFTGQRQGEHEAFRSERED